MTLVQVQVKGIIINKLTAHFVENLYKMSAMNLCMNRKTEPIAVNPAKKSAGYEAVNKYVKVMIKFNFYFVNKLTRLYVLYKYIF